MTSKRLALFIGLSILLHVVLLFFFQFALPYLPKTPHEEQKKAVKVTLVRPPQPVPPPLQPAAPVAKKQMFVDTANLPTAKQVDPNTPLESDNNTNASSKVAGDGPSFVPNQKGIDAPGLDLTNSKPSIENKSEPAPPTPKPDEKVAKAEPKSEPPKEKPDPKDPVDPKEQKQPPQVKPPEPLSTRTDGEIQLTKAQPEEAPKPSPEVQPKTQQPQQNATPRSPPPPTQFSALKQQNTINGGAPMGPGSSVESRETELGRYKAKLFRGIGSRWYLYVQQDNGLLGVGNVKIRFYVRSDGVITNLEILQGKQNAQLAAISRRSIMEISGQLEPFSDSLKVQLGEGYTEEVTFSIY